MSGAKKNKFNKAWVQAHLHDPYVKLAQREGYRARAAYKLKEIDEVEGILRPGQVVVDLGSTPGSWSQYVRNKLSRDGVVQGTLLALDILPMDPIPDVHFLLGDFREDEVLGQLEQLLAGRKVDVVLSDMAPNLSGIPSADAARIEHLTELALDFAEKSFAAGRSTVYDLNGARNNFANAQGSVAQAKYNYLFSMKLLNFYAGIPLSL